MIHRTEPDHFPIPPEELRFLGAVGMHARYVNFTRALHDEPRLMEALTVDLVEQFAAELIAGDMTVLGDRTLRLYDAADMFVRNLATLLIEAPVLYRRTPNTFPTIVVSPTLLRVEAALRAAVRQLRSIKRKAHR